MKSNFLGIFIFIAVFVLASCNEPGKRSDYEKSSKMRWATVSVGLNGPSPKKSPDYEVSWSKKNAQELPSQTETILIIAVPEGTGFSEDHDTISDPYDKQLATLISPTKSNVTLTLPLNQSIELFEYTFNQPLTLAEISGQKAYSTSKLGPIIITPTTTDITVQAELEITTAFAFFFEESSPANDATGVNPQTAVIIRFSDTIAPESYADTTIGNADCSIGNILISYDNFTSCYTASQIVIESDPSDDRVLIIRSKLNDQWSANAHISVKIGAELASINGSPLDSEINFSFDTVAPTSDAKLLFVFSTPADNDTSVDLKAPITIQFSEPVSLSSATIGNSSTCTATIQISADNFASCYTDTQISVVVNPDSRTLTLTPTSENSWPEESGVSVKIGTELVSVDGSPLDPEINFGFNTISPVIDPSPAQLLFESSTPVDNDTNVDLKAPITIQFSEPVSLSSATIGNSSTCVATIQISTDNFATCLTETQISVAADPDSKTLTLTPTSENSWPKGSRVSVKIGTELTSVNASPLESEIGFGFNTISPVIDPSPAQLLFESSTPVDNDTNVDLKAPITIQFSEPVSLSSATIGNSSTCVATIQISTDNLASCYTETQISVVVDPDSKTLTLTPTSENSWPKGSHVSVKIGNALKSTYGVSLESDFSFGFNTTIASNSPELDYQNLLAGYHSIITSESINTIELTDFITANMHAKYLWNGKNAEQDYKGALQYWDDNPIAEITHNDVSISRLTGVGGDLFFDPNTEEITDSSGDGGNLPIFRELGEIVTRYQDNTIEKRKSDGYVVLDEDFNIKFLGNLKKFVIRFGAYNNRGQKRIRMKVRDPNLEYSGGRFIINSVAVDAVDASLESLTEEQLKMNPTDSDDLRQFRNDCAEDTVLDEDWNHVCLDSFDLFQHVRGDADEASANWEHRAYPGDNEHWGEYEIPRGWVPQLDSTYTFTIEYTDTETSVNGTAVISKQMGTLPVDQNLPKLVDTEGNLLEGSVIGDDNGFNINWVYKAKQEDAPVSFPSDTIQYIWIWDPVKDVEVQSSSLDRRLSGNIRNATVTGDFSSHKILQLSVLSLLPDGTRGRSTFQLSRQENGQWIASQFRELLFSESGTFTENYMSWDIDSEHYPWLSVRSNGFYTPFITFDENDFWIDVWEEGEQINRSLIYNDYDVQWEMEDIQDLLPTSSTPNENPSIELSYTPDYSGQPTTAQVKRLFPATVADDYVQNMRTSFEGNKLKVDWEAPVNTETLNNGDNTASYEVRVRIRSDGSWTTVVEQRLNKTTYISEDDILGLAGADQLRIEVYARHNNWFMGARTGLRCYPAQVSAGTCYIGYMESMFAGGTVLTVDSDPVPGTISAAGGKAYFTFEGVADQFYLVRVQTDSTTDQWEDRPIERLQVLNPSLERKYDSVWDDPALLLNVVEAADTAGTFKIIVEDHEGKSLVEGFSIEVTTLDITELTPEVTVENTVPAKDVQVYNFYESTSINYLLTLDGQNENCQSGGHVGLRRVDRYGWDYRGSSGFGFTQYFINAYDPPAPNYVIINSGSWSKDQQSCSYTVLLEDTTADGLTVGNALNMGSGSMIDQLEINQERFYSFTPSTTAIHKMGLGSHAQVNVSVYANIADIPNSPLELNHAGITVTSCEAVNAYDWDDVECSVSLTQGHSYIFKFEKTDGWLGEHLDFNVGIPRAGQYSLIINESPQTAIIVQDENTNTHGFADFETSYGTSTGAVEIRVSNADETKELRLTMCLSEDCSEQLSTALNNGSGTLIFNTTPGNPISFWVNQSNYNSDSTFDVQVIDVTPPASGKNMVVFNSEVTFYDWFEVLNSHDYKFIAPVAGDYRFIFDQIGGFTGLDVFGDSTGLFDSNPDTSSDTTELGGSHAELTAYGLNAGSEYFIRATPIGSPGNDIRMLVRKNRNLDDTNYRPGGLTAPNTFGPWVNGGEMEITWETSDVTGDYITLYLLAGGDSSDLDTSADAIVVEGKIWRILKSLIPNDGSEIVPVDSFNGCHGCTSRVLILSTDGYWDISDTDFGMTDPPVSGTYIASGLITLDGTDDSTGSPRTQGDPITISWDSGLFAGDSVSLYYLFNTTGLDTSPDATMINGKEWRIIGQSVPNAEGTFDWDTNMYDPNSGYYDGNLRILIISDTGEWDISDVDFQIILPFGFEGSYPAPESTDVDRYTPVFLEFSDIISPGSLSDFDGSCADENIQVSTDDFTTCLSEITVAIDATDDRLLIIDPGSSGWGAAASVSVKIGPAFASTSGNTLGQEININFETVFQTEEEIAWTDALTDMMNNGSFELYAYDNSSGAVGYSADRIYWSNLITNHYEYNSASGVFDLIANTSSDNEQGGYEFFDSTWDVGGNLGKYLDFVSTDLNTFSMSYEDIDGISPYYPELTISMIEVKDLYALQEEVHPESHGEMKKKILPVSFNDGALAYVVRASGQPKYQLEKIYQTHDQSADTFLSFDEFLGHHQVDSDPFMKGMDASGDEKFLNFIYDGTGDTEGSLREIHFSGTNWVVDASSDCGRWLVDSTTDAEKPIPMLFFDPSYAPACSFADYYSWGGNWMGFWAEFDHDNNGISEIWGGFYTTDSNAQFTFQAYNDLAVQDIEAYLYGLAADDPIFVTEYDITDSCSNFVDSSTPNSGSDITPPVLECVAVTPSSISGPGTVTVRAGLTDIGTGVNEVSVSLSSPSNAHYIHIPLAYNSTTGLYDGTGTLSSFHEAGAWQVQFISFGDQIGNWRSYNSDPNLSTSTYTYYDSVGTPVDTGMLISGFELSDTTPDTDPPAFTSINVTPSSVSGPGAVTIEIDITDSGSGVNDVFVSLSSPSNAHYVYIPLAYNSATGLYDGVGTLSSFHEAGAWQVQFISFGDQIGNWRSYNSDPNLSTSTYTYYDSVGTPVDTGMLISGFELSDTTSDTDPPAFTSINVTPSSVSGPGAVTIEIDITDSGSGVNEVFVSLSSPSNAHYVHIPLAYNNATGLYDGVGTLSSFHEAGAWQVQFISFGDQIGNWRSYNSDPNLSTSTYTYYDSVGTPVDTGILISGFDYSP